MTNQEYLQKIINKYKKTQKFNSEEERLFNLFKNKIESWFNTNSFKYGNPTLEIKQSGSKAKGTAIIGHSDIDLFLSITDRNNTDSLKNFFIDIRDYLKTFTWYENPLNIRTQTFSIGTKVGKIDIDFVPAKKINSNNWYGNIEDQDHYLWNTDKEERMLTNISKQIQYVKNNNRYIDIIILMKVWKNLYDIDISSCYLEFYVIKYFNEIDGSFSYFDLGSNLNKIFKSIAYNFTNIKIVDVGNTSNILSDKLSSNKIEKIMQSAKKVVDSQNWSDVYGNES